MLDLSTIDAFVDLLAERIAAKVVERTEMAGTPVKQRLLTVEQAGVYLGRTTEAVEHMVASSKLPTVRSDRRVFLDLRDLDAWIDDNKRSGVV